MTANNLLQIILRQILLLVGDMSDTFVTFGRLMLTARGPQHACVDFLQGQLAGEFAELGDAPTASARLSRQGRVVALVDVQRDGDEYLLYCETSLVPALHRSLLPYAAVSRVQIARDEGTYLLEHPNEPSRRFVSTANPNANCLTFQQVIDSPAPLFTLDASELFTAHELMLPELNITSLTKGCYLGQEIVARMEGRSSKRYRLAKAERKSGPSAEVGDRLKNASFPGAAARIVLLSSDSKSALVSVSVDLAEGEEVSGESSSWQIVTA